MSGIAMSAVLKHSRYAEGEKTYVAFKVLMVIADHANREGVTGTMGRPQACLSTERIAQEGRISKKSVLTWLPKIEESGELTRTIYGEAGSRHTVYKINLPMDGEVMELSKLTEYSNSPNLANELMEKIDLLVNQMAILVNERQNLVNDLVNQKTDLVNEKAILVNEKPNLVNELGELGERLPVVRVPEPLTGLEPVTGEREERTHTRDVPKIEPLPDSWLKANNIPSPRSESERQALAHPAVIAWLKATNLWPSWATLPLIMERLGDCPDSGALTQVYQLWVGSGFRPGNVLGVLEWYGYRIADPDWQPGRNGRASPQPPPAMYSANQPNADGVF